MIRMRIKIKDNKEEKVIMIGLKPIKIPSAKERVASELRKAILSKQIKEGENLTLESVAQQQCFYNSGA